MRKALAALVIQGLILVPSTEDIFRRAALAVFGSIAYPTPVVKSAEGHLYNPAAVRY